MITFDPNWWGLGVLAVVLVAWLVASRATYRLDRERDTAYRELDAVHRRYNLGQTDTERQDQERPDPSKRSEEGRKSG